jgi:hypothetical protein
MTSYTYFVKLQPFEIVVSPVVYNAVKFQANILVLFVSSILVLYPTRRHQLWLCP